METPTISAREIADYLGVDLRDVASAFREAAASELAGAAQGVRRPWSERETVLERMEKARRLLAGAVAAEDAWDREAGIEKDPVGA